jgi:ribonuclease HII
MAERERPGTKQRIKMPRISLVSWHGERDLWNRGYTHVAGIDEAGRGALAGPVVAAAVIFPPGVTIANVDDSKRLTPAQRDELFQTILRLAMGVGVGYVDASVIDRVNIRQGTLLAMQAAVQDLAYRPDFLLIDGRDGVPANQPQRMVVRGDQTVGSIAAASIVAKVSRDRYMESLDDQFQGYGLAQHKGYGTVTHLRAIQQLGPTMIHRITFRGVVQTASRYD